MMILSAMGLMAAEDKTIQVTTLVDEDGENSNACSLREAIKTAKLDKSYGGCNVGRRWATDGSAADVIQLQEGDYVLDSELVVESAVKIYGATPYSYTSKSPINNLYPTRETLKTTISGQGKSRLFNTLASQAPLDIYSIVLKDGYSAEDGATLYVAGPLSVNDSEIRNARAGGDGAAIYAVAMNNQQNIKLEQTLLENNTAAGYGSVLAMDCVGNLGSTQTVVDILGSSIVKNGSSNTQSILDFCGSAVTTIENSTIAQNIASNQGHILRMVNQANRPLTNSASLALLSNTVVENQARSTLYYDNFGTKVLAYNVLAYNQGLSCEYAGNGGVPDTSQGIIFAVGSNAIQKTGDNRCVLPAMSEDVRDTDIDLSNMSMSSVLSVYLEPSITTRYLGLYYPRDNQTETDLVNIGSSGCSEVDQRGISRTANGTLILDPNTKNSCEIGAVELRRLTAADITDLSNTSLAELQTFYQQNIDDLKNYIANENTPAEELPGYESELKDYLDLQAYTEQYKKYRAIYVDPFALAMPEESLETNAIVMRVLNAENYDVIMQSIGVGELTGEGSNLQLDGAIDEALKCEWKPDLKRIMIYRTDGKETSNGDYELCSYNLVDKQSQASSKGLLKATFVNLAPIATNDEYSIRPESNLVVTANPLDNDSDGGDGPASSIGLSKPDFYHNEEGLEIPIRIVKLPAGVSLEAERQGACPDPYQREICYGGKLTFSVNNNFSQSSYSMEYNIFDADAALSNTATITLKNTVKDTNTSSGGGSIGLWSILALFGLVAYRKSKI